MEFEQRKNIPYYPFPLFNHSVKKRNALYAVAAAKTDSPGFCFCCFYYLIFSYLIFSYLLLSYLLLPYLYLPYGSGTEPKIDCGFPTTILIPLGAVWKFVVVKNVALG